MFKGVDHSDFFGFKVTFYHAADAACSVSRLINENSSKEGEGITIK